MKKFIIILSLVLTSIPFFYTCSLPQTQGLNNPYDPSSENYGMTTVPPPSWKFVGGALGNDVASGLSLALRGNVPYVAFKFGPIATDELRVVKFDTGSGTWISNGDPYQYTQTHTNLALAACTAGVGLASLTAGDFIANSAGGTSWGASITNSSTSTQTAAASDGTNVYLARNDSSGSIKVGIVSLVTSGYTESGAMISPFLSTASPPVHTALSMTYSGGPIVAYVDNSGSPPYLLKVARFTPGSPLAIWGSGGSWAQIGASLPTSTNSSSIVAVGTEVYIAYLGGNNLYVKKESGGWTAVGSNGLVGALSMPSLKVGAGGSLYVAFKDTDNGISVYKLVNNEWRFVGNPGFAGNSIGDSFSFDISASGVPYVAFNVPSDGGRAKVMKFE